MRKKLWMIALCVGVLSLSGCGSSDADTDTDETLESEDLTDVDLDLDEDDSTQDTSADDLTDVTLSDDALSDDALSDDDLSDGTSSGNSSSDDTSFDDTEAYDSGYEAGYAAAVEALNKGGSYNDGYVAGSKSTADKLLSQIVNDGSGYASFRVTNYNVWEENGKVRWHYDYDYNSKNYNDGCYDGTVNVLRTIKNDCVSKDIRMYIYDYTINRNADGTNSWTYDYQSWDNE